MTNVSEFADLEASKLIDECNKPNNLGKGAENAHPAENPTPKVGK